MLVVFLALLKRRSLQHALFGLYHLVNPQRRNIHGDPASTPELGLEL